MSMADRLSAVPGRKDLLQRTRQVSSTLAEIEALIPDVIEQVTGKKTGTLVESVRSLQASADSLQKFIPAALDVYNQVTLEGKVTGLERRAQAVSQAVELLKQQGRVKKRLVPGDFLIAGGGFLGGLLVMWWIRR